MLTTPDKLVKKRKQPYLKVGLFSAAKVDAHFRRVPRTYHSVERFYGKERRRDASPNSESERDVVFPPGKEKVGGYDRASFEPKKKKQKQRRRGSRHSSCHNNGCFSSYLLGMLMSDPRSSSCCTFVKERQTQCGRVGRSQAKTLLQPLRCSTYVQLLLKRFGVPCLNYSKLKAGVTRIARAGL